jgi:nucleotide-binding universal stress UspA family protein
MKHKSFIVPHDFTQVATVALNHAIETSKRVNTTIHILHVVEKQEDIASATDKIDEIIASHTVEGITLTNNVRIGNIFTSIAEFAAEHQAEMIFMGTHGAHGWQHVVGSNALRVVTSSPTPFIIVQEKAPKSGGYKNIVVPLDLHKETKQKLAIVAKLARYFSSKVHIVTPEETDSYLKYQVETNILFAESYFKELGIEMDSSVLPGKDFDHEVIRYSVSIDADLISIMNLNRQGILGVFTTSYEQAIITNDALIPTLILNPVETTEIYGAWFD